jgi:hypothetical protein
MGILPMLGHGQDGRGTLACAMGIRPMLGHGQDGRGTFWLRLRRAALPRSGGNMLISYELIPSQSRRGDKMSEEPCARD